MSCFFCDSFYHLSQNCNKYVSDVSRRNFANLKNCCSECFNSDDGQLPCKSCKLLKKCYICYSNSHHIFLCRHRNNVLPLPIPNINNDLLQRLFQLLTLEEQYLLAFSSPLVSKFVNLKPLSRMYRNNNLLIEHSNMNNFVITESYNFTFDKNIKEKIEKKKKLPPYNPNCFRPIKFFETKIPKPYISPFRSIIFRCKQINIYNGVFTAKEFMQLFSVQLVNCCFSDVLLLSIVTFESIIKAAPSMEFIRFYKTNLTCDNLWPDDIFKWNYGNGMSILSIPIQEFDFDLEKLVAVIKEKSKPSVYISLDITNIFLHIMNGTKGNDVVKKVEKKMLPHFDLCSIRPPSWENFHNLHMDFIMKPDKCANKILSSENISSNTPNSNLQTATGSTHLKPQSIILNIKP